MISTRSVELVIDTVVCLTLAKWKTVSGQFGGYLTLSSPIPRNTAHSPAHERHERNASRPSSGTFEHSHTSLLQQILMTIPRQPRPGTNLRNLKQGRLLPIGQRLDSC